MPVTYTNRKGVTYTLYRGQTAAGNPRYHFGRQRRGEPVAELPLGFRISESPNGVVSLVKDKPALVHPEEVTAVEAAVRRHPRPHQYRVVGKHDRIEIYEQVEPDFALVFDELSDAGIVRPGLAESLRELEARYVRYAPVLRFILREPAGRVFAVERMCYLGSIDGWLALSQAGTVAELTKALVPTLGTDAFFDLW